MNVTVEIINDGDVTTFAGSMSIKDIGVLGLAMGSNRPGRYIDMHGHIMGRLFEF
jgi:hypothetical protein